MVAPNGVSTCRSKGPEDVWLERTCDYVVASGSLKGNILPMEVVEDFESTPHKAVSFFGKKREGDKGVERAEAAEGAWLQWRKVARKEHKRERQRRRRATRTKVANKKKDQGQIV